MNLLQLCGAAHSPAGKADVKYFSLDVPHYRHAENCDREARLLSEQEADSGDAGAGFP